MRKALLLELNVYGTDGPERCKEFLDEAPHIAEHRKDLSIRRARLGNAKVALRKFNVK